LEEITENKNFYEKKLKEAKFNSVSLKKIMDKTQNLKENVKIL